MKIVKIVKMEWTAEMLVCTHSGNGENSANVENSENGMICYGVGCVPRVKMVKMVKIVKMAWAAGVWVVYP